MSTRKFESSYPKIQKKRKVGFLIAQQKGTTNKFIKIDKKNELENASGYSLNKQDNNNIDIRENNNRERKVLSDDDNSDSQTHMIVIKTI